MAGGELEESLPKAFDADAIQSAVQAATVPDAFGVIAGIGLTVAFEAIFFGWPTLVVGIAWPVVGLAAIFWVRSKIQASNRAKRAWAAARAVILSDAKHLAREEMSALPTTNDALPPCIGLINYLNLYERQPGVLSVGLNVLYFATRKSSFPRTLALCSQHGAGPEGLLCLVDTADETPSLPVGQWMQVIYTGEIRATQNEQLTTCISDAVSVSTGGKLSTTGAVYALIYVAKPRGEAMRTYIDSGVSFGPTGVGARATLTKVANWDEVPRSWQSRSFLQALKLAEPVGSRE